MSDYTFIISSTDNIVPVLHKAIQESYAYLCHRLEKFPPERLHSRDGILEHALQLNQGKAVLFVIHFNAFVRNESDSYVLLKYKVKDCYPTVTVSVYKNNKRVAKSDALEDSLSHYFEWGSNGCTLIRELNTLTFQLKTLAAVAVF